MVGVFNDQAAPTPVDAFAYQASLLTAPPFGPISAANFAVSLTDNEGTALSSGALPKPMPDLSNGESPAFEIDFTNPSKTVGVGSIGHRGDEEPPIGDDAV